MPWMCPREMVGEQCSEPKEESYESLRATSFCISVGFLSTGYGQLVLW